MKNLVLILIAAASMNTFAFECKAGSYLCRRYMSQPDMGINSVCIRADRRKIVAQSDNGALEFSFEHKPHWRGCAGVIGLWDCIHQIVEISKGGIKAVRRSVISRVRSEASFELSLANGEANLTYKMHDSEEYSRSYVCEQLYADYSEKKGGVGCSHSVE